MLANLFGQVDYLLGEGRTLKLARRPEPGPAGR